MKRIKILCGVCKSSKYYSIMRGIKKISLIIVCENCRHFYLKLKNNPFILDCISPLKGSCFKNCSFMKTRCKCCWAMQILDSCPHPSSWYSSLSLWLSEDCRKLIRGKPLTSEEVKPTEQGKVIIEVLENGDWVEASLTEREMAESLTFDDEDDDHKEEKDKVDESDPKTKSKGEVPTISMASLALEAEEEIIDVDDELVIDDPGEVDLDLPERATRRSSTSSVGSSSKSSERIKRKRKKVEYFTKPVIGRKMKGPIHGSDGKIIKSGVDLCDCLQVECVGCHFPCPKCRSPKCGNECRVNRRWYYEKVEVEGTKLSWVNRFVPKI